jgi:hypothetical protein
VSRHPILIAWLALMVLVGLALVLGGHRAHDAKHAGGAQPPVARPTAPSQLQAYRRPPVALGAPGSAQRALYRFAQAYGNISAATAKARGLQLQSLATGQLASALEATQPSAESQAVRGLPPGAVMSSTIASLSFGLATHTMKRAAVVLEQRLVPRGGASGPPVETSFVAELLHTRSGWRVARFTPVP